MVHRNVVVDCLYDDPWGLGLSGTVNPGFVKIVHQNVVVDCFYDGAQTAFLFKWPHDFVVAH